MARAGVGRVALLALLLLAQAAPFGAAAAPQAASWSPRDEAAVVQDVAVAADGSAVAAALGANEVGGPSCIPPACVGAPGAPQLATTDLAILSVAGGWERGGANNVSPVAQGRTHVVFSRDGTTLVSLGMDAAGGGQGSSLKLYYDRLGPDRDWGGATANESVYLPGAPIGLVVSSDGLDVVAAVQSGFTYSLIGYRYAESSLVPTVRLDREGVMSALSASADLTRLVVVGNQTLAGFPYGSVQLVVSGQPQDAYFGANGTRYQNVSMDEAGSRFAATTSTGLVQVFPGRAADPVAVPATNATVDRIVLSADGSRLAVAQGGVLSVHDVRAEPALLHNATLDGAINDLAVNHTGEIVAAATTTGLSAYAAGADAPLWRLAGNVRTVAIDAPGRTIAYAVADKVFAAKIPRAVSLEFPGGADRGPARVVEPGGAAVYDLILRNPGAAPERVRFSAPSDLSVTFEPAEIVLRPDEQPRVAVTVQAPASLSGTRGFNVTAIADSSGITDDATLEISLAPVTDVSLLLNISSVTVIQETPHELILTIQNRGTKDIAVSLRPAQAVSMPPDWNVRIEPASLTLAAQSVSTAKLIVTPPRAALNGTTNAVTVFLEGEGVADQARIVYSINPNVDLDVRAASNVKYVEPGRTATFNVTIRNTGSLPREFQVYYQQNETSGRAWAVRVDTRPLTIGPGQEKTIQVNVTAPADTLPPDHLEVELIAAILPLLPETTPPKVRSVTLFANAANPPPKTPEDDGGGAIPGPEAVLVALAAAGVALLVRRRGA